MTPRALALTMCVIAGGCASTSNGPPVRHPTPRPAKEQHYLLPGWLKDDDWICVPDALDGEQARCRKVRDVKTYLSTLRA